MQRAWIAAHGARDEFAHVPHERMTVWREQVSVEVGRRHVPLGGCWQWSRAPPVIAGGGTLVWRRVWRTLPVAVQVNGCGHVHDTEDMKTNKSAKSNHLGHEFTTRHARRELSSPPSVSQTHNHCLLLVQYCTVYTLYIRVSPSLASPRRLSTLRLRRFRALGESNTASSSSSAGCRSTIDSDSVLRV